MRLERISSMTAQQLLEAVGYIALIIAVPATAVLLLGITILIWREVIEGR